MIKKKRQVKDDYSIALGLRILELREAAGYTLEQLGTGIGTTGGSIGNYERAERAPNLSMLNSINDFLKPRLGDNLFYLVTGVKQNSEHADKNIVDSYIKKTETSKLVSDWLTRVINGRVIRTGESVTRLTQDFMKTSF